MKRTELSDIEVVGEVSNLHVYSSLFLKRVPRVMIDFLQGFLVRLGRSIGLEFKIALPSQVTAADPDTWPIFRKLEILRRENIVKEYFPIRRYMHDEPALFASQVSIVGVDRIGMVGYGRSLWSQKEAWGPAYGEAVERWCCENFNVPATEKKRLTAKEIEEETGIDFLTAPGINPEQRKQKPVRHGNSLQSYSLDAESTFDCVKTKEITKDTEQYVPLQFFSFAHAKEFVLAKDKTEREPIIYPLVTTGGAAGLSYDEAVLGGMGEIIERDAFMIYWTKGIVPKRLNLESMPAKFASKVREIEERFLIKAHFLLLKTDFPVHVVTCVLVDETGKGAAVILDSSAEPDASVAAEKAFLTTLGLRPVLRRRQKELEAQPGSLRSEKLSLGDRPLWWFPKERLEDIQFFLEGEEIDVPNSYSSEVGDRLQSLLDHCRLKNYPVFVKNIMPRRLQELIDLHVVWVKMPNMQPLYLEEWERGDFGQRLDIVPKELSLQITTASNSLPHPYS